MTTWHAPPDLLTRYVDDPAGVDDTAAASLEEHLLACAACRAVLAEGAPAADLDRSWLAVADLVDRPSPSGVERLLTRIGVAGDTARLVGSTGALQVAWLLVVAGLAAVALVVAAERGAAWPFLVVAPLLPVVGTALAFLPVAEPGGEAAVAAPLHGLGVAIRRVLATVLPTVGLLGLATPLLPADRAGSAAWLLPALALAAGTLLLATAVRVAAALGLSTGGWLLLLSVARVADRDGPFERAAPFGGAGQLLALGVLLAASAGLVARRDRFSTLEVGW